MRGRMTVQLRPSVPPQAVPESVHRHGSVCHSATGSTHFRPWAASLPLWLPRLRRLGTGRGSEDRKEGPHRIAW